MSILEQTSNNKYIFEPDILIIFIIKSNFLSIQNSLRQVEK